MEQPLHPQVWHPRSPISVRLWDSGTTQTQDLRPPSVCLHLRQQYLYRLRVRPPRSLLDRERSSDDLSLLMVILITIIINRAYICSLLMNKKISSSVNGQYKLSRKRELANF